jgi:putative transposase
MVIEIKRGKIIELDKEYVIVDFAINADNNKQLCVILQDMNGLLTIMSLSNLENSLFEQEKKKNTEKQKLGVETINKIDNKLFAEAKKRLEIIKAIMDADSVVEKEKIAQKYKVHLSTIYRWIEKYEKSDKTIYGLIPDYKKRGGKGKKRVKEKALKIINKIIKEKYGTTPIKKLHEEINATLIKENLKPIAYTTLLNYVKDIENDKEIIEEIETEEI